MKNLCGIRGDIINEHALCLQMHWDGKRLRNSGLTERTLKKSLRTDSDVGNGDLGNHWFTLLSNMNDGT